MGNSNALRNRNFIDSASMLFESTPQPPSRQGLKSQLALKRRLEQLNASMHPADDIMQDPEFFPPTESKPKSLGSKIALIVIALAAAIGWTALIARTAEQRMPSTPRVQSAPTTPVAIAPTIFPRTPGKSSVQ